MEGSQAVVLYEEPLDLTADTKAIAQVFAGVADYEPASVDSAQVTAAIFEQLANAGSEAELWKEPTTWSSKDAIGTVFAFGPRGQIWPSKFAGENGQKGAFLSVEAVDVETGEAGIFNTSSPRIAARLAWYARQPKGMPITLRVVKRAESSQGYPILDLERV